MIELLNTDCLGYMATLADNAFDLAIVDPPYGIKVSNKKHYGRRSHTKAIHSQTGTGYTVKRNDYIPKDWDNNIPDELYFSELKRVSKNQIVFGWNYYNLDWGKGLIKWNKLHAENLSFSTYEYAYCSLMNEEIEFKYLWSGMMQAKSLNEPTTQQANKKLNEKRIHPTQKPVNLYAWLLQQFANYGDKVLDTHLGSGSSAIAAEKMGFDFVGCEIDVDYYEAAKKRFYKETDLPLFKL